MLLITISLKCQGRRGQHRERGRESLFCLAEKKCSCSRLHTHTHAQKKDVKASVALPQSSGREEEPPGDRKNCSRSQHIKPESKKELMVV